jgi:hypothetical protein
MTHPFTRSQAAILGRSEPTRSVRQISRTSFELTDLKAFDLAIEACVDWISPKAGGRLPTSARAGEPFDLEEQYQANPCRATRLDAVDGNIWAARLDERVEASSDGSTPARSWITEMFVERRVGQMVRFGAQLSCVGRPDDRGYELTRPRLVLDVLEKLSAEADGVALQESPTVIDLAQVDELEALLYDPVRRLPVLVATRDENGRSLVDPISISRRLSGTVHIVDLLPEASWELTRSLGRRMSVFGGALRVYMPGLTDEDEEPFRHPLFLKRNVPAIHTLRMLADRLLPLTLRESGHDGAFHRVSEIRRSSFQAVALADRLAPATAPEFQESNEVLRRQVDELLQDLQSAETLNEDEMRTRLDVEAREEALKAEVETLKRRLTEALRERPVESPGAVVPDRQLESYEDLEDWAEDVLGEDIVLMPQAAKDCRKNGSAAMLRRIESVLLVLRDEYVPARKSADRDARLKAERSLQTLGFEDTPCFATREDARNWAQYSVVYRNEKTVLYDHFKNGNGYDNSSQARIYYAWDDDLERLVIGKMPSHLRNSHTN